MTTTDSTRVASWRLLLRNPVTAVSALILVAVAIVAVGANALAPQGVNDVDVPNALHPPRGGTGSALTNSGVTYCPACWLPLRPRCGSPWSASRSRWWSA